MKQTSTDVAQTANNWLEKTTTHQPNDNCSLVSWSQLAVYGQLLPGKFPTSAKFLSYLFMPPVSSSIKILNTGTIKSCFYRMILMVNRHNAKIIIIIKKHTLFTLGNMFGAFSLLVQYTGQEMS